MIKWVFVYFPYGKWVDLTGDSVKAPEQFKCVFNGQQTLLSVMTDCRCPAGHGEAAMTSKAPKFIDANTGKLVEVKGFVSITSAALSDDESALAAKVIKDLKLSTY